MPASDQNGAVVGPLLSIIMPLFNGERFLAAGIENFLAQDCPEAELLIIDGGSTDRSLEIVRAYAQAHPPIRWLSEKDRGQSDAMNKGIALARGEYISFLNADDFYEPGTLKRIVALLREAPSADRPAFLLGNCRIVDESGVARGINRPGPITHRDLLLGLSKTVCPINPSAYFYARSLHDAVGLYQVEEHQHMDLEFLLRLTRLATPRYHDEIWGNFRLYEGTKSYQADDGRKMLRRWRQIIAPFREALPWPQRPIIKLLSRFYDSGLYRWLTLVRQPAVVMDKVRKRLVGKSLRGSRR